MIKTVFVFFYNNSTSFNSKVVDFPNLPTSMMAKMVLVFDILKSYSVLCV